MKYRLTNRQAQIIYWSAENDQYQVKEGSPIHREFLKLLSDDPYKNPKFRPTIDVDILGYWLGKELAEMMDKNHPESLQAIKYYTTHVIEVLSVKS